MDTTDHLRREKIIATAFIVLIPLAFVCGWAGYEIAGAVLLISGALCWFGFMLLILWSL
jgi:hypothetical protein